jgi:hypothetical protein
MTIAPIEYMLWLIPLAVVAYALGGNRPSVERFAAVHDLELDARARDSVRSALLRTRRGRIAGAAGGALVAVVLVSGFGSRAPAIVALAVVLVGTLLGIGVAQRPVATSDEPVRSASLAVRDAAAYRPRRSATIVAALLLATAAYSAIVIGFADHSTAIVAGALVVIMGVDLVVAAAGAQFARRVAEQTRDQSLDLEVDDALRATTVRALHRAVLGVLLCGIAVAGFIGVESQMFQGVQVGDRVEFRFPAGASFDGTTDVHITGDIVTVTWRDAGGERHATSRPAPDGAGVTVGLLTGNVTLLAVGAWLAMLGFLGAFVQWGRASKAWRHAPPSARPEPVGSAA